MGTQNCLVLLLMEEIGQTTWDVENTVNNGINYQPQLVTAGFQPSTVSWYPMDWNWEVDR